MRAILLGMLLGTLCTAQEDTAVPTFGTTVVISAGLKGDIYHIGHGGLKLSDLKKKKPHGTIYTTSLNIPVQNFDKGFPGVTSRFEWFAIDYTGRFWIEKTGEYRFALLSDDGAQLYIDNFLVIDNSGIHPPLEHFGTVGLKRGVHEIHVPYFQGPRFQVALVLRMAAPGEDFRVFNTQELKPPNDALDMH